MKNEYYLLIALIALVYFSKKKKEVDNFYGPMFGTRYHNSDRRFWETEQQAAARRWWNETDRNNLR